jgi:Tfp pilus assembly protein PilN
VRAVNLIPLEARRTGGRGGGSPSLGPGSLAVFLLAAAVVLTLIAVLTDNTISDRRARLATVRTELAQETAQAARLSQYTQFVDTARQRADTVRQIAASRFDWHNSLRALAKVVPANTSFQSLDGSVTPTSATGGAASGLRSAIDAPAFEISGCTSTQDDVAHLIYRLRAITGVTRVTLSSTQKAGGATTAVAPSGGGGSGCPANGPAFNLVVFFSPLSSTGSTAAGGSGAAASPAGAAASGVTPVPVSASSTTAQGSR